MPDRVPACWPLPVDGGTISSLAPATRGACAAGDASAAGASAPVATASGCGAGRRISRHCVTCARTRAVASAAL
jgi:hypothetical protein